MNGFVKAGFDYSALKNQERLEHETATKVAIVTGGNKGIGLATVKRLAELFNGDVFLTARDVIKGMKAVENLQKTFPRVFFHQLDINDPASIEAIADFFKRNYQGIDILVNNAAVAFKEDAQETFGNQAKIVIGTNFFGVKMTCEFLFPLLKNGARVVNISSAAGCIFNIPNEALRQKLTQDDLTFDELDELINDFLTSATNGTHLEKGWPNSTYVVSKVGLSALTRIQQRVMDKIWTDVAINHVHPGYVSTDMTSHKGHLSVDQGAMIPVLAATLPANTDNKGKYIWYDGTIIDWANGPYPPMAHTSWT